MPATATEVKAVRLELLPSVHQELREVAARHGQSMAAYVRELVLRELARIRSKK